MAALSDNLDEQTSPSDALAARYLEAFWRARETFAHAIAPVLRDDHDLDLRDYGVLRLIERQGFTPGGLAGVLQIPGYATSRVLDPLIKRGFVERQVDAADARRYRLHLTGTGRSVTRAIEHQVAKMIGQHLADLGPERTELVVSSLEAFAGMELPTRTRPNL
ncbi:MarR family winged helix-turn-helix transcriptional regulator [Deinococcus sp. UYEF24]